MKDSLSFFYEKFVDDLTRGYTDGVEYVNLDFLYRCELLNFQALKKNSLTYFFQIIEDNEKVTLFNDQFAVWITPKRINSIPSTFVIVAVADHDMLRFEVAFSASGVYNSSSLVLQVLEYYLKEIQETQVFLSNIKDKI